MALKAAPELRRLSLRFVDEAAERGFQDRYLRDNLPYIRGAHVVGIAAWAFSNKPRSKTALKHVTQGRREGGQVNARLMPGRR